MSKEALYAHLATGHTHVCQCWKITRRDGTVFGFTDHDRPLEFGGVTFVAESGMSAKALSAGTGLAVDNSEALGLLQSEVISEADIMAGRYDGAEVRTWLVRWDNVAHRVLRFVGTVGEITRDQGRFRVELRGLSDQLNQPQGRSFLRSCSAVLGDSACGVDASDPLFAVRVPVEKVTDGRVVTVTAGAYVDRWFEQGVLEVMTGEAKGLTAAIKHDQKAGARRLVDLWDALRAPLKVGDDVRLLAGCDKRAETCRVKFDNLVNFRGFPHIPGEDWLMAVPRSGEGADTERLG